MRTDFKLRFRFIRKIPSGRGSILFPNYIFCIFRSIKIVLSLSLSISLVLSAIRNEWRSLFVQLGPAHGRLCCSLGLSIKTHSIYRLHEISISFSPFGRTTKNCVFIPSDSTGAFEKESNVFVLAGLLPPHSNWTNERTNCSHHYCQPPSHTATYSTLQRKILWWRSQFSLLPSCLMLLKWIIYSFNYEHFFHL